MKHSKNEFDALVDIELRGGHGRERLVEDPDRWREALIRSKVDLECQLGARRIEAADGDDDVRSSYRKWKPGALRVRSAIEARLSLIRTMQY